MIHRSSYVATYIQVSVHDALFNSYTKITTKIDREETARTAGGQVVGILVDRKVDPGMRNELVMAQGGVRPWKGLRVSGHGGVFFFFFPILIFIGVS